MQFSHKFGDNLMKIRALAAVATATALVLSPLAAQAGTTASSKSYGAHTSPRVSGVNQADGEQKVKAFDNGTWVIMSLAAAVAAGIGIYYAVDDSGKTPGGN